MNYYRAIESIERHFMAYNGYRGALATCGLSYCPDTKQAICVYPGGCFAMGCRLYAGMEELLYYFDNHRSVHFHWLPRMASEKEIAKFNAEISKYKEFNQNGSIA